MGDRGAMVVIMVVVVVMVMVMIVIMGRGMGVAMIMGRPVVMRCRPVVMAVAEEVKVVMPAMATEALFQHPHPHRQDQDG